MTTNNTTTIANATTTLIGHLTEASLSASEMAVNLLRAMRYAPELEAVRSVAIDVVRVLDLIVEEYKAKADAEAEIGMREAAGAAVASALDDKGWSTLYNPGALGEALAEDSDELASEEAARLKAANLEEANRSRMEREQDREEVEAWLPEYAEEADNLKASDDLLVENMRERLLENAEWAAVNPELANHGFIAKVLWVGSWRPDYNEAANITRGIPGAVWVEFEEASEVEFQDNPNPVLDMVNEAMKRGCDTIAGEWSIEMAIRIGRFNKAGDGDLLGVRIAFPCGRKHGNWKFTIV